MNRPYYKQHGINTLTNATTGTGTAINTGFAVKEVAYVKWGANTTGGTVVIEVADSPAFAGTWRTFATLPWVAVSTIDVVQISEPVGAVRGRVTSNITGSGGTAADRAINVVVQAYD